MSTIPTECIMVYLVFQVFLIEFLKLTVAFFSKLFLLELLVLVHLCDKDDLSCLAGRHRLFHDGSKFLGAHALFKEPCLFLVAARNGKSVVEKNGNNTLKPDGGYRARLRTEPAQGGHRNDRSTGIIFCYKVRMT